MLQYHFDLWHLKTPPTLTACPIKDTTFDYRIYWKKSFSVNQLYELIIHFICTWRMKFSRYTSWARYGSIPTPEFPRSSSRPSGKGLPPLPRPGTTSSSSKAAPACGIRLTYLSRQTANWNEPNYRYKIVLVNLCQKHSFLNQLTHSMTTECSLITDFSTRKIQVQNIFL